MLDTIVALSLYVIYRHPMSNPADRYADKFRRLRVNRAHGEFSPHKPCMLLAVIEMFEAGRILENTIVFDDVLVNRYADYFNIVKREKDRPNPWMPYFHLKSDGFWWLHALQGREHVLESLNTATARSDIEKNVSHVELDEALFKLLSASDSRLLFREILILHWFPEYREALSDLWAVVDYEKLIVDEDLSIEVSASKARSAAFRRLVLEAYDFRCAASGWKLVLPDLTALVEAAHIIPFSESQNDHPRNGMALTPNFHWAMDRNVIAPGPDFKWHVSPSLDKRIADNRPILDIEGADLLLPRDPKFHPKPEFLAWRLQALLD